MIRVKYALSGANGVCEVPMGADAFYVGKVRLEACLCGYGGDRPVKSMVPEAGIEPATKGL